MREIVLDTETTGLDPLRGDRLVEVGCIEIYNRMPTGQTFHRYINPERDSDEAALAVHGLTTEFLSDKPKFHEIAEELRAFVQGAEIIIHNAPFDLAFIEVELCRESLPGCVGLYASVIDTLSMARDAFPGKRNNLDALCERYGISNAHRTLHGALLDAQLLAEVYLAMTRGQETLSIDMGSAPALSAIVADSFEAARATLVVILPSEEELAAHTAYLAALDKESRGRCMWLAQEAQAKLAA